MLVRCFPFMLAILFCLIGATRGDALTQQELDQWRSLWESQQLDDYGYQFQRSCNCFGEWSRQVVVGVEGGVSISATDTQTLLGFSPSIFPSIDDLFGELQSAIDYPAASILAEFDPVLGYPTSISIDLEELIADEEIYYVTSRLDADLSLPACDPAADRSCAGPLIDALSGAVGWWDDFLDFNGDDLVDAADREFLITQVLQTSYGDSTLDGRFNSGDFVAVFQAGEFEDSISSNSGWSTGDWNGDFEFDTSDLVLAFQVGGYQLSSVPVQVQSVPEPSSVLLGLLGFFGLGIVRRGNASIR